MITHKASKYGNFSVKPIQFTTETLVLQGEKQKMSLLLGNDISRFYSGRIRTSP